MKKLFGRVVGIAMFNQSLEWWRPTFSRSPREKPLQKGLVEEERANLDH